MKFKMISWILLMIAFLSTMSSCSADKRALPPDGYSYCRYCHGTGYDYYYLGGLISEECSSCGGSGYSLNPSYPTGMPIFKGRGHTHIDKKIPWNECDICSLHTVYW